MDEQVEWFKGMFIDWLTNLQKNAIAENAVIEPEVIGRAFQELADYYKVLDDMPSMTNEELWKEFFEE